MFLILTVLAFLASSAPVAQAQMCSGIARDSALQTPKVADGYAYYVIKNDLKHPRGILFDSAGHLLIVDVGTGIVAVTLESSGANESACFTVRESRTVVPIGNGVQGGFNHGIALSVDGKRLYASTISNVYEYDYDAPTMSATNRKLIIKGMINSDHSTRTLLLSRSVPGIILVSRGSADNLDLETSEFTSMRSVIKAFNISEIPSESFDYATSGVVLGWGLRNSVGIVEDSLGQIWSVENSADNVRRSGADIHLDNPGEELNFLGVLVDALGAPEDEQRQRNYGYPLCFAVWNTSAPGLDDLNTGESFVMTPNSTVNDSTCNGDFDTAARRNPRLTFQAHTAPLDMKFDWSESSALVTLHGSWNRQPATGYELINVPFSQLTTVTTPVAPHLASSSIYDFMATTFQPSSPVNSTTGYTAVLSNSNVEACPRNCFRPVGLAFHPENSTRSVFMSSDATGEIFVIRLPSTLNGNPTTTTGGSPSSTSTRPSGCSKSTSVVSWLLLSCSLFMCIFMVPFDIYATSISDS